MTQKLGMAEFFAMEAGEYLERLDALVSAPDPPSADEFQRLARALRGAALMANQQPIAAASGAFEQLARAVRDGSRPWDEATRQLAIRTVDDLKVLVRRVREWTDDDTARAHDLANAVRGMSGRPSAPLLVVPSGPDPGTRAFIGREGAALASALDLAAKSLSQNPLAYEPLKSVLSVMQPLRGLASLSDLPPMTELLEGIEAVVGETMTRQDTGPGASEVFASGAAALSVVTREVATEGTANPESEEVRGFAALVRGYFELDQPIRPIESLYFDDAGPHVVEQGTAPSPSPPSPAMAEVEFVSHGERLRQIADALDEAKSPTIHEFRSHGLVGTFRALDTAGVGGGGAGSQLGDAAAAFARAAWSAVAAGRAIDDTAAFAAVLREAGAVLSTTSEGTADAVAQRLGTIAAGLGAPPPPPVPTPSPAPAIDAAPAPAPAPVPEPVPTPATAATAAPAAPPAGPEGADLSGSFQRFHRYTERLGLAAPSLDELLAGPAADPGAAAAPVTPDPATTPEAPAAPPVDEALVPITDLVYSPGDALARAMSLQQEVQAAVVAGAPTAADLVEEIFDLVKIGLPETS